MRWPWQGNEHKGRGWYIGLVVLLVLLVVVRLALPALVKTIVNHKLADMPGGYRGSVEDVAVRLLDGEIGLRGFRIVKKNGLIPVPFMQVKELVLGTVHEGWRLRSTLKAIQPNASFVDAESEAHKQKGPPHQLDHLQEQLPFMLLWVEIVSGQFHFRNYQTKPDIDAYVHDLNVRWDHLVGCLPPGSSACRSSFRGNAALLTRGKLKVQGAFARSPEVDLALDAHVDGLHVPQLNPVLKQYAKIDVKKGDADLDLHWTRAGDTQHLQMVPLLHGFDVVGGSDKDTSFMREVGVAAAAGYFERKQGEKAIAITSKPGKGVDFKLIDLPQKGDDKAKHGAQ